MYLPAQFRLNAAFLSMSLQQLLEGLPVVPLGSPPLFLLPFPAIPLLLFKVPAERQEDNDNTNEASRDSVLLLNRVDL